MTQLERRYDSVLSISMRPSYCQHAPGHGLSSWEEIMYVSQHTAQQFAPTDAVRLNRASLDGLRSAWGLTSFNDESIVILAIILSGHQPVQIGTLSSVGCADPPGPPDEQKHDETEVAAISGMLPGASPTPPVCDECSPPSDRYCFPPNLAGTLPQLLCMTDSSFLEEISWVMSLAQNDNRP